MHGLPSGGQILRTRGLEQETTQALGLPEDAHGRLLARQEEAHGTGPGKQEDRPVPGGCS